MGEDAFGGEQLQRLANRKAGDAEPLSQFLCRQMRPDGKPAASDMLKDLRGETFCQLALAIDRALPA
ncbi:hypothetical protein MAE02_62390 [Microvirga aerophila]|uniref:Uncharacterized protein n=1 Tax=Microvirga aerophila TaxID=670291 RepID=A0A512C2V2_9HYPH|nr:hypothetical protein MAE02_62390 [Microvirga aerophila]